MFGIVWDEILSIRETVTENEFDWLTTNPTSFTLQLSIGFESEIGGETLFIGWSVDLNFI